MKISNRDMMNIYKTYNEIIDSKPAKAAVKDGGDTVYAIIKAYNKLTPIVQEVVKQEISLRQSAQTAATPETEESIYKTLNDDINKLYDDETQDVALHQVNKNIFKILQEFLTGASTVTLLNLLTQNEHEPSLKVVK